MTILGHGIDLVENHRIAAMLESHGDRFLTRVFTPAEREFALRHERRRVERLAVRFAAKEAVVKALGTGMTRGIAWTDVEVVVQITGQPTVALHGRAAEIAAERGVSAWSLSLTHTGAMSAASAIALGSE